MKRLGIIPLLLLSLTLYGQEITSAEATLVPQGENEYRIEVTMTIPEGLYQGEDTTFFSLTLPENSPWLIKNLNYPSPNATLEGSPYYQGLVTLTGDLILLDSGNPPEGTRIVLNYQLCNDQGVCFFPQSREVEIPLPQGTSESPGNLQILYYLLLAFLGGILLNLMPCVFPLLSVKALSLVGQGNLTKKELLNHSALYTGGIIFTFWILAGIIITIQLTGTLIGWGFQFQNPWFVYILSLIIFLFSLSLFDVYVMDFTFAANPLQGATKGRLGAFFTGIFAVLVATPCTAPLMGSALGFAFSQPPVTILLIFTALGLGLALPYNLLAFFPRLIRKLPKPGAWMDAFKQVMGFMLLGTSLYMLNTLSRLITISAFMSVLTQFLLGAFGIWIIGKGLNPGKERSTRIYLITLGALIMLGSFSLLGDFSIPKGEQEYSYALREGWEPFSQERFDQLREEGQPVFVDFYAQWCTNCKINEINVLHTERMDQLIATYGIKVLKGDFTQYDPVIASWLKDWGKAGLPAYALYVPGKKDPLMLPEILTFANLEEAFQKGLE